MCPPARRGRPGGAGASAVRATCDPGPDFETLGPVGPTGEVSEITATDSPRCVPAPLPLVRAPCRSVDEVLRNLLALEDAMNRNGDLRGSRTCPGPPVFLDEVTEVCEPPHRYVYLLGERLWALATDELGLRSVTVRLGARLARGETLRPTREEALARYAAARRAVFERTIADLRVGRELRVLLREPPGCVLRSAWPLQDGSSRRAARISRRASWWHIPTSWGCQMACMAESDAVANL